MADRRRRECAGGAASWGAAVSNRPAAAPRRRISVMRYKMGVVGLGVMGANLARNIESKGFPVAGYDLDAAKAKAFPLASAGTPEQLMAMLERPRRVLVMVPAGAPVDSVITHLRPHL